MQQASMDAQRHNVLLYLKIFKNQLFLLISCQKVLYLWQTTISSKRTTVCDWMCKKNKQ